MKEKRTSERPARKSEPSGQEDEVNGREFADTKGKNLKTCRITFQIKRWIWPPGRHLRAKTKDRRRASKHIVADLVRMEAVSEIGHGRVLRAGVEALDKGATRGI